MAQVLLQNVTKRFGRVTAVERVDLRVEDRQLVVLVGPSGCGKTTTLRLIAGLEPATGGTIHIGRRRVDRLAPKDRNVAMVFQNYALYPHWNVFQNLAFGLRMRGTARAEIERRVRDTSRLLGIEDLLERRPAQLSGGQCQRVALGRAIARQADVYLLDEPLGDLDAQLRAEMHRELVKLHQRMASTVVHVTHDQQEAMVMGQRIAVMNQGRILQVGRPMDLYDHPSDRFVAGFLGSPPMNFFEGTLVAGAGKLHVVAPELSLELPSTQRDRLVPWIGRRVTLGIRPEDVHVSSHERRAVGGASVRAELCRARPLGRQVVLEMRCGRRELRACADRRFRHGCGELLDLVFDMANSHLFDPESGKALATARAGPAAS